MLLEFKVKNDNNKNTRCNLNMIFVLNYSFHYLKKLLTVSKLFENDIFMEKIQYTFNNNTMQHFFGP
jgi:hypothetical protein